MLEGGNSESRPSFGNSYVNNFIREEEMQKSQQKHRIEISKMESVAMFGENATGQMTPQESSIKMQDIEQDESTLNLQ